MLSKLLIKNYALIDALDINFDQQLNIITGETGAGKSIIMGALGLILGNRAESKYLFDASTKCVIEGHFYIKDYQLKDVFETMDLDYEDTSIIRREIHADGKSRSFINDTPVTLQTLKVLGEKLIDIHSQHATLQINTEAFQLMVLDSIAQHPEALEEYKKKYKLYKKAVSELKDLADDLAKTKAEHDYFQFIFNELDQANLVSGEQQTLESEQAQLINAEEIKRYFHLASSAMVNNESNVLDELKSIISNVQNGIQYLPAQASLLDRLQSSMIELKDISNEIEQVSQEITMDEERLSIINERLSVLYNLQQKHRLDSIDDLLVFKDETEEKILSSDHKQNQIDKLHNDISALEKDLHKLADLLSENRTKLSKTLENEIQAVLARVGMPWAKLKVEIKKQTLFKASGCDEVSFLFAANKGQTVQSINKVASGGELSRVMLAIKSIIAKSSSLPTIIFDEIDTGISGEVALRVGELMEELSEKMQVISITHLPQIASQGKSHFKVYKEDEGDKTKSNIALLNHSERIMEIAQMLDGAKPEDTAIEHAKKMLKKGA